MVTMIYGLESDDAGNLVLSLSFPISLRTRLGLFATGDRLRRFQAVGWSAHVAPSHTLKAFLRQTWLDFTLSLLFPSRCDTSFRAHVPRSKPTTSPHPSSKSTPKQRTHIQTTSPHPNSKSTPKHRTNTQITSLHPISKPRPFSIRPSRWKK
jgi:hypothetical protein